MAKLTKNKVENALIKSYGNIAKAAQICRVTRKAIYDFISANPELESVRTEAVEASLDLSEDVLMTFIAKGKRDAVRLGAIKYHLSTKGASRGYGKKLEIKDKTINLDKIFEKLQQDPNREPYLRRLMTEDPEKVLLEFERVSIQG